MSILDSLPDEPEEDPSPESQTPDNQCLDKQEQLTPGSPLNSVNQNTASPQLKVDAPLTDGGNSIFS